MLTETGLLPKHSNAIFPGRGLLEYDEMAGVQRKHAHKVWNRTQAEAVTEHIHLLNRT